MAINRGVESLLIVAALLILKFASPVIGYGVGRFLGSVLR
jgi:hypothetical protein